MADNISSETTPRRLPPLAALRAFEATARHLSVKHAAQELSVTPTAVSHQLRLLEQVLGVTLFERLPRRLVLSAHGAARMAWVSSEKVGPLAASRRSSPASCCHRAQVMGRRAVLRHWWCSKVWRRSPAADFTPSSGLQTGAKRSRHSSSASSPRHLPLP